MDSPRSAFRRAHATSWAFAGIGVAGVVGASALAYADTVKPAPVDQSTVVETVDPSAIVAPTSNPRPTVEAPLLVTAPTPSPQAQPVPVATPEPRYTPEPTFQQAPATHQAPAPGPQSSFPIRTSHSSGGSSSPNYSPPKVPHVTRSRGS